MGWEPGAFLAAYAGNRRDVVEAAFEADAVAVAIWKLITTDRSLSGFEGTATELLDRHQRIASEIDAQIAVLAGERRLSSAIGWPAPRRS